MCSVPNHPSRHTRVLTRCAESSVAVCRSVPKHPVAKHPCAETSVCRNCFWPKHPGPVDDDVVNLFTGANTTALRCLTRLRRGCLNNNITSNVNCFPKLYCRVSLYNNFSVRDLSLD